jgi:integrase
MRYVHWIKVYIVFHGKVHPASLGAAHVSAFVSWLAEHRRVSAFDPESGAQCGAVPVTGMFWRSSSTRFPPVVRARTPERLPVVLSRSEVASLLGQLSGALRLIVTLLYGAGLRPG